VEVVDFVMILLIVLIIILPLMGTINALVEEALDPELALHFLAWVKFVALPQLQVNVLITPYLPVVLVLQRNITVTPPKLHQSARQEQVVPQVSRSVVVVMLIPMDPLLV